MAENISQSKFLEEGKDINLKDYAMNISRSEFTSSILPILSHYAILKDLFEPNDVAISSLTNCKTYFEDDGEFVPVYFGNLAKPLECKKPPVVELPHDGNNFHSIAMINLDCQTSDKSPHSLQWLV